MRIDIWSDIACPWCYVGKRRLDAAIAAVPEIDFTVRYRAFQLEHIAPHCGDSVLEVGAGVGEFAAQFSGLRRHIVTDVDPAAVDRMAERFRDRPEVSARVFDLAAGPLELDEPPPELEEPPPKPFDP